MLTTIADVLARDRMAVVRGARHGGRRAPSCSRAGGPPRRSRSSAGLAITQITTQIIKGAVDRPRPGDGIADVDGFAYPSGHAALVGHLPGDGGGPVTRRAGRLAHRAGDRRRRAGGRDRPLARVPAGALPDRRGRRLGPRAGGLLALRSRRPHRRLSASTIRRPPEAAAARRPRDMDSLTVTYIILGSGRPSRPRLLRGADPRARRGRPTGAPGSGSPPRS